METFLIDLPMPAMGATVHELTIVSLRIQPGARVVKGQKLAELESDKSVFEFEAPCDGTVRAVLVAAGEVRASGSIFLQIETSDPSLKHLQPKGERPAANVPVAPAHGPSPGAAQAVWTPRALRLAQEAGLVPEKVRDIEATGPGSRVSGDDVARYLEKRKQAS